MLLRLVRLALNWFKSARPLTRYEGKLYDRDEIVVVIGAKTMRQINTRCESLVIICPISRLPENNYITAPLVQLRPSVRDHETTSARGGHRRLLILNRATGR